MKAFFEGIAWLFEEVLFLPYAFLRQIEDYFHRSNHYPPQNHIRQAGQVLYVYFEYRQEYLTILAQDDQKQLSEWLYPNESNYFNPLQGQVVRWEAIDDNFANQPIVLSFVDGGVQTYPLTDSIVNNGMKFIYLPDINSSLGQFQVIAQDLYGNSAFDRSDEYFDTYRPGNKNFIKISAKATKSENRAPSKNDSIRQLWVN